MIATLTLMGSVRLRGTASQDLTPRSQKSRGALAILGTAPDLRMTRARLQDLLWSDRGQQQGSDSLRQMLRELRASLGSEAGLVLSGVGWIGLDPDRVRIDLSPVYDAGGVAMDFASDLDIPDPEFESWLRDMRLRLAPDQDGPVRGMAQPLFTTAPPAGQPFARQPFAAAAPRYVVSLEGVEAGARHARILGRMVLAEAAARACEMIPATLAEHLPATERPLRAQAGARLSALCHGDGCDLTLMVMMRDLASGAQIWAYRCIIRAQDEKTTMRQATAQITVALLDRARRTASPHWAGFPIWDVFSHSAARLRSADAALARFQGGAEAAVAMALRSYLRGTLVTERLTSDPAACQAEAEDLVRQALELAPTSPIVLAAASLTAAWRHDPEGALMLAHAAERKDPDHEMACHALSLALSDLGRNHEALELADRGAHGALADLGPACWMMRRALVLVRLGRFSDAENNAAAAYAFAPDNRPSLRYLAALRFHRGDVEGAADALRRLRLIEPDFSLELMAHPDYPVRPLRRAGLMGLLDSRL
ncbi:MAG: SARP family transcriptional regulator [Paracoccus sp. (in: a-proteobacteria)]|uniref:SARP family transcriptional regulator n=1 Tax=Paracoccus sp. TaxID=267 RepID=UPI0039E41173